MATPRNGNGTEHHLPEPALPNPFASAMQEFTHTKQSLAERTAELRQERELRISVDQQLALMNEKFDAYKDMTDAELKSLREENRFVQAYCQAMRTRLAVIKEIITVCENEAMQYATKSVRGAPTENDEEVTQSIRDHFNEQRRIQEEERGR